VLYFYKEVKVKKTGLAPILTAVLCCVTGAGFFSCAVTGPGTQQEAPGERAPVLPGAPPEKAGSGLDAPAFRDLPPEAAEYLELLGRAFADRDRDFLVSQGETSYEADNRSRYDDETYLAMLYRVGPYREDSPFQEITLPRLEYAEIRGIRYTAWEEKGPLIRAEAYLVPRRGETIPCEIMLLWRLKEPKILGIYP
jgi:hypothetical protein